MNKRVKLQKLLNAIMVVAILSILVAGFLAVGSIRGWFDNEGVTVIEQSDGTVKALELLTKNKKGIVNIERNGIAYLLNEGDKLRDGDIIQTLNGSAIDLVLGNSIVSLDENSEAHIEITESGEISLDLNNGNLFANISEPFTLEIAEQRLTLDSGVFSASSPFGSSSIYVFENEVSLSKKTIKAGEMATILSGQIQTAALSIQSLNDFELRHIKDTNKSKSLFFTNSQIEAIVADRESQMQEALQAKLLKDNQATGLGETQDDKDPSADIAVDSSSRRTETATGVVSENKQGKETNSDKTTDDNDSNISTTTTSKAQTVTTTTTTKSSATDPGSKDNNDTETRSSCTISIRCDTILDNMADLTKGKDKYVPSNGVILATSKLYFEEGETVFDVLKRACSLADIQLEFSWFPIYNSHYIEGINHLYEFDCGSESGWMYKVNGWFPNYGASAYKLKDGDVIQWVYTCKGLGADVGGGVY